MVAYLIMASNTLTGCYARAIFHKDYSDSPGKAVSQFHREFGFTRKMTLPTLIDSLQSVTHLLACSLLFSLFFPLHPPLGISLAEPIIIELW